MENGSEKEQSKEQKKRAKARAKKAASEEKAARQAESRDRARPAKRLPPKTRLHLEVLQNGAPQVSVSLPLRGLVGRRVRVGRSIHADLRVPFAQLPDALRVFRVSGRGASVFIDPRFEGFLNDGSRFGTVREFISPRGSLSDLATVLEPLEVHLHEGARGSLRFAGYEILFRVDAREQKKLVLKSMVSAGRGAFALPESNHPVERAGVWIGAAATLAVFLPLTLWLLKAPQEEAPGLANLPEEYALSLVHPEHYKSLPFVFRERMDDEDPTSLAIEWIDALRNRWAGARSQMGEGGEDVLNSEVSEDSLPILSDFPVGDTDKVDAEVIERRARQAYGKFQAERERNPKDRYLQMLKGYPRVLVDTAAGMHGSNTVQLVRDIQRLRKTSAALASQAMEEQHFLMDHYKESGVAYLEPYSIPKMEVITGPAPDEEFALEHGRRERVAALAEAAGETPLRARLMDWAAQSPGGRPTAVWLGEDGALSPHFLSGRLAITESSSENLLENARYAARIKEVPPAPSPKPVINMMDVDLLVYAKREELRSCYEAALRRNKRVGGEVHWQMEVDGRGALAGLKVARTDIKDREFLLCLQERVRAWRFPVAKGGVALFQYPFRFRRGGQESR